jgi:predicted acyl esterase
LECPPALRSIVPGVSAAHSWINGGQMHGGVHELGTRHGWVNSNILADMLMRRHRSDPAALERAMDRFAADAAAASTGTLLDTLPLAGLTEPDSPAAPLMEWLRKPVTDPEWQRLNLEGRYSRLQVPTFHIGGWRSYSRCPVPGSHAEQWYLHPDGGLDRRVPAAGEPDTYRYDPRDPVPTVGGATLLAPSHPSGPYDQRRIEARPDILS